jgi:hypothetical protein
MKHHDVYSLFSDDLPKKMCVERERERERREERREIEMTSLVRTDSCYLLYLLEG